MNKFSNIKKTIFLAALTGAFTLLGTQNSAKAIFFGSMPDVANKAHAYYVIAVSEPTTENWDRVAYFLNQDSVDWGKNGNSAKAISALANAAIIRANRDPSPINWEQVAILSQSEANVWEFFGNRALAASARTNAATAKAKSAPTQDRAEQIKSLLEAEITAWEKAGNQLNAAQAKAEKYTINAMMSTDRVNMALRTVRTQPTEKNTDQLVSSIERQIAAYTEIGDTGTIPTLKSSLASARKIRAAKASKAAKLNPTTENWNLAAQLWDKAACAFEEINDQTYADKSKAYAAKIRELISTIKKSNVKKAMRAAYVAFLEANNDSTQEKWESVVKLEEAAAEACIKESDYTNFYISKKDAIKARACAAEAETEKAMEALDKSKAKEGSNTRIWELNRVSISLAKEIEAWRAAKNEKGINNAEAWYARIDTDLAQAKAFRDPTQENLNHVADLCNIEAAAWEKAGDKDNADEARTLGAEFRSQANPHLTPADAEQSTSRTVAPTSRAVTRSVYQTQKR